MSKVIAHIDLNTFFVRCEELKNPKLEGKPVAVGHNGRGGIVSTCSYEARNFGVRSGMPMFKAKELCPKLIIIEGNYNDYEAYSNEFEQFIKRYTNKIEKTSIDECYADFTEQIKQQRDPIKYFKDLQYNLFKTTGLKCSIGISTTKFLAKMGSDLKKPMGITVIRKSEIQKILFNNPVETFYGIGKKTATKLNEMNVNTIGELYSKLKDKNSDVYALFGKFAQDYIDCLEGNSGDLVIPFEEDQKSISTRRTLPYDINNKKNLHHYLIKVFNETYEKFLSLKVLTGGITISLRYTDFKTKTFARQLDTPIDDKNILLNELESLYDEIYHGENVRQIGVIFYNLSKRYEKNFQMTLDNYLYFNKKDETLDIMNELNKNLETNSKLFIASDLLKDK